MASGEVGELADGLSVGISRARVAELIVTHPGGRRRGSGYRVTAEAVLTAAHVLDGAELVQVRFEPDLPHEWITVAVSWWVDVDSDLAVVSIAPRASEAEISPAIFGRIGDRAVVLAVQAVGFPRWKMRTYTGSFSNAADVWPRYRDAHHVVGSVPVLSNWREGTLEVVVQSDPAPGRAGEVSPWEGMSGAALWAGARIVGVVAKHHPSDGLGRLAAIRIDRCLDQLTPACKAMVGKLLLLPENSGQLPDVVSAVPGSELPVTSGFAMPSARSTFPSVPLVWNVPARLATFTGRTDLLNRIDQLLQSPESQDAFGPVVAVTALRGLGGVGKTQLAVEYAWLHRDEYAVVWWLDAEQVSLLGEKMAALGPKLGLQTTGIVSDDAAAVLSWLSQTDRWLLIFDNATSSQDLRPWLPHGRGHVLVTSRSPRWGAVATRVDVDVLTRHEATALLQRQISGLDEGIADELAAELGDLPLALSQAAAYLERTEVSPESYLTKFRAQREKMLARGEDYVYGGRVDSVWSISLERLQGAAPATVQLLQLASFCAPGPIPLTLFAGRSELLPSPLSQAAGGENSAVDLDDVVAAALDYSLCHRSADTIQLHRLVQSVIRAQLSANKRVAMLDAVARLLVAARPVDPDRPESWAAWTALGPHILHVSTVAVSHDIDGFLTVVNLFCWHLIARGDYAGASQILADLYRRHRTTFGPDDYTTLYSAANLATVLRSLGQYQAARELCEDTLMRHRRLFGDDDRGTLHAANNLASCLLALGDNAQARELGEDTLDRSRRMLGDDDHQTLATAGNLACALSGIGQHHAARRLAEDTLGRFRQLYGTEHRETQWAASTLVDIVHTQGDNVTARAIAEETLSRYRNLFGDDHPDTVRLATTLAAVLVALGEDDVARALKLDLHALDNETQLRNTEANEDHLP